MFVRFDNFRSASFLNEMLKYSKLIFKRVYGSRQTRCLYFANKARTFFSHYENISSEI